MWHPTLGMGLVAQVTWDLEMIGLIILLTGLIFLGVWAIVWVKRWRQHNQQTRHSPEEEISSYRQLLEQGVLRQEEFDRVRIRLEQKSRGHPEVTAPPEKPAPPPASESEG
jgi:hypothetical protein